MSSIDLGRSLSLMRIALGAAAWLAPGIAVRVLGDAPAARTSLPLFLRLFGARDVAMGLGYLQVSRDQQDRLLLIGMGVDAADGVASLLAARRGQLPALLAVPFAVTAAAAVVAAAAARRQ